MHTCTRARTRASHAPASSHSTQDRRVGDVASANTKKKRKECWQGVLAKEVVLSQATLPKMRHLIFLEYLDLRGNPLVQACCFFLHRHRHRHTHTDAQTHTQTHTHIHRQPDTQPPQLEPSLVLHSTASYCTAPHGTAPRRHCHRHRHRHRLRPTHTGAQLPAARDLPHAIGQGAR